MAATTRSDTMGNALAEAYAFIATAMFVVFAIPVLIVALATRQQWLALTLSILGACAFVVLMASCDRDTYLQSGLDIGTTRLTSPV